MIEEFRAAFTVSKQRGNGRQSPRDVHYFVDKEGNRQRLEQSQLRELIGMPVPRKLSLELHEIIQRENDLLNGGGTSEGKHARREVTEEELEKFEIRCNTTCM